MILGDRVLREKAGRPGHARYCSGFRQVRDFGLLHGDALEEFFYL